jgi:hypothetical protein
MAIGPLLPRAQLQPIPQRLTHTFPVCVLYGSQALMFG